MFQGVIAVVLTTVMFTIGSSNVRSLNPHTASGHYKTSELEEILRTNKISVMGITETWLHHGILPNDINIPGYSTIHRKDRQGKTGGGVAILISDTLPSKRRVDLETCDSNWEDVWVEVTVAGNKVLVSCVYRPPVAPDSFFDQFETSISKVATEKGTIVITGDFNCHHTDWGDTSTDNNALNLVDILERYGLYQCQHQPTRCTPTC